MLIMPLPEFLKGCLNNTMGFYHNNMSRLHKYSTSLVPADSIGECKYCNICLNLSRASLIGCYRCSMIRPKWHIVLLSLTEYICTSSEYDTDDHSIFNKPDNKSYEEAKIGWLSSQQEHQSPHLCLPSPLIPSIYLRLLQGLLTNFPGWSIFREICQF